MDIKTTVNDRATKVKTTVDSIEVAEDVYVYRAVEKTTTTRNGKSSTKTQTVQGVCKGAALSKVRAGALVQQLPKYKGYWLQPCLLTDEYLAEVKQFGYAAISQRNYKGIDRCDFFDYVAEGGSLENLVLFYSADHSFYRIDGSFMPTGVMFTYLNESMCSRSYDLDKVVEILSKRDDITFINCSERGTYGKPMPELVLDEPKITPVPHYNSDCGSEIRFAYTPTEEQAKRIDAIRQEAKNYLSVSSVILTEDMLGIKGAKRERDLIFARDDEDDDRW